MSALGRTSDWPGKARRSQPFFQAGSNRLCLVPTGLRAFSLPFFIDSSYFFWPPLPKSRRGRILRKSLQTHTEIIESADVVFSPENVPFFPPPEFEEPRVIDLWDLAQSTNFTEKELESLRVGGLGTFITSVCSCVIRQPPDLCPLKRAVLSRAWAYPKGICPLLFPWVLKAPADLWLTHRTERGP